MTADDLAELNANQWGTFASDSAATSIVDDRTRRFAGEASLLFQTASGFDTGISYPKTGNANWDLSSKDFLTFLHYPINNNAFGFQGNQPIIVLRGDGGSFRYTPKVQMTFSGDWQKIVVDLAGNGPWTRSVVGAPSFSNIDQLEIHYDTWDAGFSIGIDAVRFGAFSELSQGQTPAGIVPAVVNSRALVYVFDPIMENLGGKRMHEAFGWQDPAVLTQQVIADLTSSSHGRVRYSVAETIVADIHPYYKDGFQHTDESSTAAWNARQFHPIGFDYPRFLRENGIADRIDSGEIDEVWLWSGPLGGFFESAMAGAGAYWINGDVQAGGGQRAFPIMGWNYERGVGEALHSFGHRAENSVHHAYRFWQGTGRSTWAQFTTIDKDSPGNGAVGNVHFPVNGQSDYDYDNPRTVQSTALDWRNYPDLTGAKTPINNRTWSPNGNDTHRDYLNWWYSLMPSKPGLGNDGYLANWWRYIADVESFKQRDGHLAGTPGLIDVRLVAPSTATTLSSGIHIFTAEAKAAGAVGRVDFYVNGVFAHSDSLSPYVFAWDARTQPGTHTLVAKAYDLAYGWEFSSSAVQVTVVGSAWTNSLRSQDVDGNTIVTPLDALLIINELNTSGARQLPTIQPPEAPYLDTSGDGFVTSLDALIVINVLNQRSSGEGELSRSGGNASTHFSDARVNAVDLSLASLIAEWDNSYYTDSRAFAWLRPRRR